MATISKTLTFEVPKVFSDIFLPFVPFGFCPAASASGSRAPEATHRCTWQPSSATAPWRSGSWRPKRPWMQRTTTAVASEEDLGGEKLLRDGIPLRREREMKMLIMVQIF